MFKVQQFLNTCKSNDLNLVKSLIENKADIEFTYMYYDECDIDIDIDETIHEYGC